MTYSVNQPLGLSVSDPSHAEVRGSNSAQGMDSTKSAVLSAMYCLALSHFLSKMSYQMRKSNLLLLSSSSSVGATTLGGFWPALRFRSTVFYLYTSLSSFSLSSSLNPLLLDQAISVLVFLLVLMNMVPIQLIF